MLLNAREIFMPLKAAWILAYRGGEMMLYKNKPEIGLFLHALFAYFFINFG